MAMAEQDATHAEAPQTGTARSVPAPGWIEAGEHRVRIPVALGAARGTPDTAAPEGASETALSKRVGVETPFRMQRAEAARIRRLDLLREFEGTGEEVKTT